MKVSIKSILFVILFWISFFSLAFRANSQDNVNSYFIRLRIDSNHQFIRDEFFGVLNPNRAAIIHPRANEFWQIIIPLNVELSSRFLDLLYPVKSEVNTYLILQPIQLTDSISTLDVDNIQITDQYPLKQSEGSVVIPLNSTIECEEFKDYIDFHLFHSFQKWIEWKGD